MTPQNPLLRDRDVAFLLDDVLEVTSLTRLPYFAGHDRETFELVLDSARRLARDVLWPAYRPLDAEPPRFVDGRVTVHPRMRALYPQMLALGLGVAGRPAAVGGQQIPLVVLSLATAYLMAANLSAYGYVGLTTGAAHLLEAFGSDELRARYMTPLYDGRWTGTMALTEPQAGSSLADVATRASDAGDGSFRMSGAKIFISGGDHDITDNIVHMVLARLDGAPPGIKGVSLLCVPKRRPSEDAGGALVDNDVSVTGVIHKIGWRGLPSVALAFGERGDCRGWLVGEPHRGIYHMFQMMNEARLMVGMNGVASASAAYHEALAYATTRLQGRPPSAKSSRTPPVAIVEHADVRRMLLRQKSIVEGALALVARTAMYADLAAHAERDDERARARLLLDLLTPVAKSFPAERGFEANVLALQVHGGYGYTSEYLPEAWLRDQKLNSIHEGTTGIQGLDLLGRKAVAGGGAALAALRQEIERAIAAAADAGVAAAWGEALARALGEVEALTMELAAHGLAGDAERMLLHSTDYLELFGILVVAWQHLAMATAARRRLDEADAAFARGKLLGAEYFLATELPRLHMLVALCRSGEDSYARIRPDEF
jgi:alkylation response protein AidB-like acyl-CoA dehydrogenase